MTTGEYKMALTCKQVLLMLGMLITGSINTITKKAQLQCSVKGYDYGNGTDSDKAHDFNHPWFQTWIMFIGESTCLIGLFVTRARERREREKVRAWSAKVGHDLPEVPTYPRVWQWILFLPTFCDLLGTSLAGIGLVIVDASVWQMLRGAIIIFAGILSRIFLKRKLKGVHWLGMMLTMFGLVLVGCSSVFKNKNSQGSKTIIGIILILGSQLVSATQMILEEVFLKKKNFPPLQVVGMEGTFGFLAMTIAVLPAMYFIPGDDVHGSYENSLDALYQVANSPRLLILCLLYLTSIAIYNFFGLAVTKSLTAVHRTLIDACRTILVWLVSLFIYYVIDETFGEEFDKQYGLLQLDGFAFLLIGTAFYNRLMDVPCLPWCSNDQEMQEVPPPAVRPDMYDESQGSDVDESSHLLKHDRQHGPASARNVQC